MWPSDAEAGSELQFLPSPSDEDWVWYENGIVSVQTSFIAVASNRTPPMLTMEKYPDPQQGVCVRSGCFNMFVMIGDLPA